MITFNENLTIVPNFPGYYWDFVNKKLYSIKIGGELKELKVIKLHKHISYKFPRNKSGDKYYVLSKNGVRYYKFVYNLNKLKPVQYELPLFER